MKKILIALLSPTTGFTSYNPKFVRSPASNIKIASAFITMSGSCTITRQDTSWIVGCSVVGTGNTTLDITGAFSTAPNCVITPYGTNSQAGLGADTTTTAVSVRTVDSGGSIINANYHI